MRAASDQVGPPGQRPDREGCQGGFLSERRHLHHVGARSSGSKRAAAATPVLGFRPRSLAAVKQLLYAGAREARGLFSRNFYVPLLRQSRRKGRRREARSDSPSSILLEVDPVYTQKKRVVYVLTSMVRRSGMPGRYLTACANDFCREAKRQTISAQDVMQAIKELEFGELEEPLKEYLDQVRTYGCAPSSAALVWFAER